MKIVDSIQPSFGRAAGPASRGRWTQAQGNAAPSRALVALAPIIASHRNAPAANRPAAFLAQLIATQNQHPQTRERRRAEPDEAAQAYELTLKQKPVANGRHISRTM